jgi:uncharacterized protein YhjY with autotransporter beta-barrel domain
MKSFSRFLSFVLLLAAATAPVHAQSLEEQYEFYLLGKCDEMNFERDFEANLLPGQAGPALYAFCTGPLDVGGGGGGTSAPGGNAGASGGRAGSPEETLRRRRERQRDDVATSADGLGRLSAFVSVDGMREEQTTTRFEMGRRVDIGALIAGVDYRFGRRGVIGFAGRVDDRDGTFQKDEGEFSARSVGVVLYGSWLPTDNFFMDFSANFDSRQTDTTRIVGLRRTLQASPSAPILVFFNPPKLPLVSSNDSTEQGFELRSGYDFHAGRFTIGPRLGVVSRKSESDAFVETGESPMKLAFEAQEAESLQSALGLQASFAANRPSSVFVTQFNVDWLHEFDDDQRLLRARFAEDLRANPTIVTFQDEAPDRSFFGARLSIIGVMRNGLSFFGNASRSFGHSYIDRTGVALGIRKEF